MSSPILDDSDLAIIDILGDDGRATFGSIGRRVGLSAPAVKRRVDRLVETGVIAGFTVRLNHEKLGLPLEAFTELRFSGDASVDSIATAAADSPEVRTIFTLAGDPDALAWIHVRDVAHLKAVVDRFRAHPEVTSTNTLIVLGRSERPGDTGSGG